MHQICDDYDNNPIHLLLNELVYGVNKVTFNTMEQYTNAIVKLF